MKAFASDKTVRLGAEGLVLWAEIHNEGDVNVVVLKCHGGDHSKYSNLDVAPFFRQGATARFTKRHLGRPW